MTSPSGYPARSMSFNPRPKMQGGGGGSFGGGGGGGRDRGQNINHLLSFTLPPRARPPPPLARRSKRGGASQPFNKERYVSAQYRFLVKPTGDYTAYFADADIYLNWGDILSVLIPTSSALSGASASTLSANSQPSLEMHEGAACPICLSPPTAPRMTKCGHVYCYPCILQYLATTDGPASAGPAPIPGASAGASVNSGNALQGPSNRQWKRCPICWDAVYARDLKAVLWWDPKAIAQRSSHHDAGHHEVADADEAADLAKLSESNGWLRLRLIERPQITTLALPQSATWPTSSTSPSDQPLIAQHQAPWHFQPDVMTFCKFMLATPDLLLDSLTRDVDELTAEKTLLQSIGAKPGDQSIAFAELAERKVREQMAKVVNELDIPAVRSAIGQAQNDLKEHADAEQHRQLRENENLSRRQRRQEERHKLQKQPGNQGQEPSETQEHGPNQQRTSVSEGGDPKPEAAGAQESSSTEVESAEGAEAFLALRAAGQGGAYAYNPASVTKQPKGQGGDEGDATPLTPAEPKSPKTHTRNKKNLNPPAPSASSYLFYQAASGQNIFLHPLDIKIMHSQFGTYSRFPHDIAVKVQSAEEGSMNEELRKRCKYLTHLPKATDVVFIEVDWDAMASTTVGGDNDHSRPLVDRGTLKQYDQILRARRNKRRDRERKEDRAKLKAEQAEAASRPGAQSAAGAMARNRQSQYRQQQQGNPHEDSEDAQSTTSEAASHHGALGTSPTFMEAAMWGAERDFPIHPGHNGGLYEDFPAPDSQTPSNRAGRSPLLQPVQGSGTPTTPSASQRGPPRKTVWGTVAAESSFSSTLHASSHGQGGQDWDEGYDDAWLELEEGFVLGTNNSKQVRAGRGLNNQQQHQSNSPRPGAQRSASSTKQHTGHLKMEDDATTPSSTPTAPDSSHRAQAQAQAQSQSQQQQQQGKGGKKQRKAKLVLTSGGRGTA